MRRPRSLFWTIASAFLVIAVGGTLVQTWMAFAVLRPLEDREQRSRAALTAARLAAEIAGAAAMPARAELDSLFDDTRRAHGPRAPWILFIAPDSSMVSSPGVAARFYRGVPDSSGTRRSSGPPEILVRQPVRRGLEHVGDIVMARPARPRESVLPFLTRSTLLFLPIAIVGSTIAGLIMLRVLVRRLRKMEMLAARVSEGDLSARIGDRSGDEIGRLAERLDSMADRLAAARAQIESTENQRRQLFADITHELATPLTSIRGYAETLEDPSVQVSGEERSRYVRGVIEESRRMDRLIRDLFELARLEAGASPLEKERLDWAGLCRHTIERFEPRFRAAGLELRWSPAVDEAWIDADGRRIEQVIDNLLVNALRYVPSGGTVSLGLERAGSGYRLTVTDDGPGVAADDLPKVFERFYRAAEVRGDGGSGLGLAIVREIIERHGGHVRAETRKPHGLEIVVELPAAS